MDYVATLTSSWFVEGADTVCVGFDTQEEEALDCVLAAQAFFLSSYLGDGVEAYPRGLERVWQ